MIGLEKFLPSDRDTWEWFLAQESDLEEIVNFADQFYSNEIEGIFTKHPRRLLYNLNVAITHQRYHLNKTQLMVARNKTTDRLVAWAWLGRGSYTPYAPEEMAEAKFAHIDLSLSTRERVTIMAQILHQWHLWCQINQIPVLVSTSIREDQQGFMNLHRSAGFTVRGSYAYKRITL